MRRTLEILVKLSSLPVIITFFFVAAHGFSHSCLENSTRPTLELSLKFLRSAENSSRIKSLSSSVGGFSFRLSLDRFVHIVLRMQFGCFGL